jgi:DNA replicative helicase MCM subunit Mcm2 (Cdc46/Mcm family)
MEDETLELRVDITDADFKKLEKGKALVLAHGIIGSSPIQIVLQRKKKIKDVSPEMLVEDTDSQKILSLIPGSFGTTQGDEPKKTETIIAEAEKQWHISTDKAKAEISTLLREGIIYEPRAGFLWKT